MLKVGLQKLAEMAIHYNESRKREKVKVIKHEYQAAVDKKQSEKCLKFERSYEYEING